MWDENIAEFHIQNLNWIPKFLCESYSLLHIPFVNVKKKKKKLCCFCVYILGQCLIPCLIAYGSVKQQRTYEGELCNIMKSEFCGLNISKNYFMRLYFKLICVSAYQHVPGYLKKFMEELLLWCSRLRRHLGCLHPILECLVWVPTTHSSSNSPSC